MGRRRKRPAAPKIVHLRLPTTALACGKSPGPRVASSNIKDEVTCPKCMATVAWKN